MLMCVVYTMPYYVCSNWTQCVGFCRMCWTRLHLLHGSGQLDIRNGAANVALSQESLSFF